MWTAYGPNFGRTEFPTWRGTKKAEFKTDEQNNKKTYKLQNRQGGKSKRQQTAMSMLLQPKAQCFWQQTRKTHHARKKRTMAKQSKLTKSPQWWKHLRKYWKRKFWKQERRNSKKEMNE